MRNRAEAAEAAAIPFRAALLFWFKLGCISFGGPAGQIALMHRELVDKRRWLSERRFLHALNYCMLLPGPEAQQLATYLGWLMHRSLGGIAAGALFVLPSLVLLIALSWLYAVWGTAPLVAGLFQGIKPAVTVIVAQAAWRIGGRTLRHPLLWTIAAFAFIALFFFGGPFPLIVGAAALTGWAAGRRHPGWFVAARHAGTAGERPPALIDDDTPPPPHARFTALRCGRVAVVGLLCWAVPFAWLALGFGGGHLLTQMGWFFTKAAFLTFGGAYAVLPYVHQQAVAHYGWLTSGQMLDGLALGETTPGPLIMVVAFVAFVGAYGQAPFGPESRLWAGVAAACLVTWFTFLPSFLFILLGGPPVETTHGDLKFTAPLTAITAAVVGVIANLALFFAGHVFWPNGWGAGPDWPATAIALFAGIALFRYRLGVATVIAASALAGLAVRWGSLS